MTRTRAFVVVCALALAASVGVACGDDGGQFDDDVAQVRAAVASGDQAGADRALEDLAIAALVAHEAGTLTDAELAEIADLIESSRVLLGEVLATPADAPVDTTEAVDVTPPTEPPTTAPPPPPEPEPPADDDDDDDDDDGKRGKKKGRGSDD